MLYEPCTSSPADALEKARKNQEAAQNGQSQEVRVSSEVSASDACKEVEKRPEPKDKTKPISSTPVPGTPWSVSTPLRPCVLLVFLDAGVWFGPGT